jgi:hypothetical protein
MFIRSGVAFFFLLNFELWDWIVALKLLLLADSNELCAAQVQGRRQGR